MRIGLFGGTLDPIHFGHLRSAIEVSEALTLNQIWFIPAFIPPHKQSRSLTEFERRLKMVELAVQGCPNFKASDIERQKGGVSYSVELLEYLTTRYEDTEYEFFFIMGADAFLELESWRQYHRLPDLSRLIILRRPPVAIDRIIKKAQAIFPKVPLRVLDGEGSYIENGEKLLVFSPTALDISSSMIRRLARQDKSIKFLVPEEVRKYIMMERLYKSQEINDTKEQLERPLDSLAIASQIYQAILDNKGEKTTVLDMRGISPIADFFIITQGRSTRHVQGMADRMRRELSRKKIKCRSVEGEEEARWILMDFEDVIVHIFYEPIRGFYDLEGLWSEAPRLIWLNGMLVKEMEND